MPLAPGAPKPGRRDCGYKLRFSGFASADTSLKHPDESTRGASPLRGQCARWRVGLKATGLPLLGHPWGLAEQLFHRAGAGLCRAVLHAEFLRRWLPLCRLSPPGAAAPRSSVGAVGVLPPRGARCRCPQGRCWVTLLPPSAVPGWD